jgi:hypothetical protein
MKPNDELIEKFRQIYMEEYGEDMSTQEAYDNFTSLVDLLRIIGPPVNENIKKQDTENPGLSLLLV